MEIIKYGNPRQALLDEDYFLYALMRRRMAPRPAQASGNLVHIQHAVAGSPVSIIVHLGPDGSPGIPESPSEFAKRSSGILYVSPTPYGSAATAYQLPWPSDTEVYGCTIDPLNGTFLEDMVMETFSSGSGFTATTSPHWMKKLANNTLGSFFDKRAMCNQAEYYDTNDFGAYFHLKQFANNTSYLYLNKLEDAEVVSDLGPRFTEHPLEVAYPIPNNDTPTSVTPITITLNEGENYIWASDLGYIELTYLRR